MLMTNFLQKRKSVRNFKNDIVPRDVLENIKLLMDELDREESDISFSLYENGKIVAEGLKGKAGYAGVMIEAPHYIALDISDDKPLNILKGGYFPLNFKDKDVLAYLYYKNNKAFIIINKIHQLRRCFF